MGPYRQDTCRRPYQDPTLLEARSLDKAIEFGGYLTLDQLTPLAISAISAISVTVTVSFYYPQIVSKFPILVQSLPSFLSSIALTAPLNLGGCVTDYWCSAKPTLDLLNDSLTLTCSPTRLLTWSLTRSIAPFLSHYLYLPYVYIQTLQSYIYN